MEEAYRLRGEDRPNRTRRASSRLLPVLVGMHRGQPRHRNRSRSKRHGTPAYGSEDISGLARCQFSIPPYFCGAPYELFLRSARERTKRSSIRHLTGIVGQHVRIATRNMGLSSRQLTLGSFAERWELIISEAIACKNPPRENL